MKFNQGNKVMWNAGWSKHIHPITKKVVGCMWRGPYDFGYIGKTGKAIIYEEGCSNMQDSMSVDLKKLKKIK